MGYPKDSLNLLSLVSEYVRPCTHLHVHLAAFARELEALKQAISEDFARAEAKQVARAKSVAALEKKAAKQEAAMHATREHLWPDTTPLSATPISNQHLGRRPESEPGSTNVSGGAEATFKRAHRPAVKARAAAVLGSNQ